MPENMKRPDGYGAGPGGRAQALRNAQARGALIDEFGLLSRREAGARMDAAGQAGASRPAGTQLFTVDVAGVAMYPGFQFDETGSPRAVIARIVEQAGGFIRGWSLALWFTGANGWLGDLRPVDVIGGPDENLVVGAMTHLVDGFNYAV